LEPLLTLNQQGEGIDRDRFRTTAKAIDKWFTDVPHARVAMEAGVHSIWISEQLEQLGHEVIVVNVRELRAISHSDRKSDDVDAEKLARYAWLDPEILRPISHRTVEQQEALTLIRARELVRLRTAAINAARGLTRLAATACPLPPRSVSRNAVRLRCRQVRSWHSVRSLLRSQTRL
jgi:transposase